MGAIRTTYRHLNGENFTLLYKALVRPHLEYAHAVWKPYLMKHINLLEGVQRRATKQLPTSGNLTYEDRLRRLNLPSLANRWLRGDAIKTFKIATGKYDSYASSGILFFPHKVNTRGHHLKLYTNKSRHNGTTSVTEWLKCGTLYQNMSLNLRENWTMFGLITHSAGFTLLRRDIKSQRQCIELRAGKLQKRT